MIMGHDFALPSEGLLVVVGPTASGKSGLAMRLAEHLDGEIIGADSVQIYRHFDLGSGKPSENERKRVRHHLVDLVDPLEPIDAARYAAIANDAITSIRARNKVPIVCGGSFLWVKSLIYGLAPLPPADPQIRARHQGIVDDSGRKALHELLAEVDPEGAARLAPNDFVRVSRALEVFEISGRTQSAWHQAHQFREVAHQAQFFGVQRERADLEERILRRSERWLAGGWLDEVSRLLSSGYGDTRAMHSVGYKQVMSHLGGELSREDLAPAIARATRIFARRQRTWLRDQPVTWLSPDA